MCFRCASRDESVLDAGFQFHIYYSHMGFGLSQVLKRVVCLKGTIPTSSTI